MLKIYGASIIWRLGVKRIRKYSNAEATKFKTEKIIVSKSLTETNVDLKEVPDKPNEIGNSGLVAAAFASLNAPDSEKQKQPSPKSFKPKLIQELDAQIRTAVDIDSLLKVAENPVVSRRHALKMVSTLSEWSTNNKVNIKDFESDPRFLKLCRILARTTSNKTVNSLMMGDDLSTVLSITGDDEAARLIENLSLSQLIKVMKALHQKNRRSTPLLRAVSHSITKQSDVIDLKKAADLLFCMTSLNFPDPVLLDRICNDVIEMLPSNKDKPAVVTSIAVSLGHLKYRHELVLTDIAGWVQSNLKLCRPTDIASLVVTLATVDFVPQNMEQLFKTVASLRENDMVKVSVWLDLVFAMLVLGQAELHHLESTIQPDFIEKLLAAGDIPIPVRRKLMTIDAYLAITHPNSTTLPEYVATGVPIVHTKEKMLYVQSIMDTFKSLVSSQAFMKRDCVTNMGFMYDGEFAIDSKCHPVSLDKAINNKNVHRIAILGLDYHDMTRKVPVPLGAYQLYSRLLRLKGFKVLEIPYTEFNPKDKLVNRVKYIERRLKELVYNPN